MATQLLSNIQRKDSVPYEFNVNSKNNVFYISVEIADWTPQMFYEMPYITFTAYKEADGTKAKMVCSSISMQTYQPTHEPSTDMNTMFELRNVPESFYLKVLPKFDRNALPAHNDLIECGIESGEKWTTETMDFNIVVSYT